MDTLSSKQCYWLLSRGGRRKKDVVFVKGVPFVEMFGKDKEYHWKMVPDTRDIDLELRVKCGTARVCEVGGYVV